MAQLKGHREKIGLALKGRMPKFIPDNSGRVLTEGHKQKIRESLLCRKVSTEVRLKISKNHSRHNLGKKLSEEHCKKLSRSHLGKKQSATTILKRTSKLKGLKRTLECRMMMSNLKKGAKHYRWNPNRAEVIGNSKDRMTTEYSQWRLSVYKRDEYKCRMNSPNCAGRIEAHHILSWAEYPELRYRVENGIVLCSHHHPKGRKDEIRLQRFFVKLLETNRN